MKLFTIHVCTVDKRAYLAFSDSNGKNHFDKFHIDACNHFRGNASWECDRFTREY